MTDDHVRTLNLPAHNHTRLRYEGGIDWERWSFYPVSLGGGGFSDGHDYAGMDPHPREGWVLDGPVVIDPEALCDVLERMQAVAGCVRFVADQRLRADRIEHADALRRELAALRDALLAAVTR
jgi:hypothetical protein